LIYGHRYCCRVGNYGILVVAALWKWLDDGRFYILGTCFVDNWIKEGPILICAYKLLK
jgi:hypothetical protein